MQNLITKLYFDKCVIFCIQSATTPQFYHQNNITPTTHIHGKKVKYKGDSPARTPFSIRTKTV